MGYARSAVMALHAIAHKYHNGPFSRMEGMFKGEIFVLNFLVARGGVAMPSELAQAMCSSTARIAVILGNLEQKEQITREMDKADRRKIKVTLTQAGKERVHRIRDRANEAGQWVFERMGEQDTGEFLRLMERFLELSSQYIENNGIENNAMPDGERGMEREPEI